MISTIEKKKAPGVTYICALFFLPPAKLGH